MSPPAGRRRVQHREGPSGPNSEAEDNGVLREEREADRAAKENVSHGEKSQDTSSPPFLNPVFFFKNKDMSVLYV